MNLKTNLYEAGLVTVLLGAALSLPAQGETVLSGKEITARHAETCAEVAGKLHDKIGLLKEEIDRGGRIYAPGEIRKLETKLKETEKLLDIMMYRPGDEKVSATAETPETSAGGPAD